ncbi:MAG: hypothetical protein HQL51_05470 [Magnetococcales bacterium]|nr:hypothetical protein [Magnetococcales bacterium]
MSIDGPLRHFARGSMIGMLLITSILFMPRQDAMAASVSGSGTILRADGMKGHFIVGAFETEEACQENVLKIVELLKEQAKFIGERITYRIHDCAPEFKNGTIYRELQTFRGLRNYTLLHQNLRLTLVSPKGHEDELAVCKELTGYFEGLLGQRAVCVAPAQK